MQVVPVIAIVGRPNVGKSTLFNQLTRTRNALVVDLPGVTRDRQYGEGRVGEKSFIVIDTGGIGNVEGDIDSLMAGQSWTAIQEADIVFFMVDGRSGLTPTDHTLAQELRRLAKPIELVVNKTDGLDAEVAMSEFFQLGLGNPVPIAASHGRGVGQLIERALSDIAHVPAESEEEQESLEALKRRNSIQLAIVGRPNVGKSTLVNRILGEERVVVFDAPGTTRDSIYIPFERQNKQYTIIDTAGVRRRARISEVVEKFSVVKALQAIEACDVVILVIDATEGITDQDLGLLGFVVEAGKSLVVAVNKWDGLTAHHKEEVKRTLIYRLQFAEFAKVHYISALHGTGVGNLFGSVQAAYQAAIKELPTSLLTEVLEEAVKNHTPPMVNGRRIKLRYAHTGGHKPPIIIIHGNQTEHVPLSYKRYLINTFRKALHLEGTPIRIEFKTGVNPFAGKRNTLTPRQLHHRKRMKKFIQKKER